MRFKELDLDLCFPNVYYILLSFLRQKKYLISNVIIDKHLVDFTKTYLS